MGSVGDTDDRGSAFERVWRGVIDDVRGLSGLMDVGSEQGSVRF